MKIDSIEYIEPKPGKHVKESSVPVILVANRSYQCKDSKNPTLNAVFTLRKEAIALLGVSLGDKIGIWRACSDDRWFYCISYIPPTFNKPSYVLSKQAPNQLKFSSTQLYKVFDDGEYRLGDGFEQEVELDGQKNIFMWHEIIPL